MQKHFYSHLVEYESLTVRLNRLTLSDKEKGHLLQIIDSSLHNTILDTLLSELNEEDKKLFLNHVSDDNHYTIWSFLFAKVGKAEEKIQKAAEIIKKRFHRDIDELEI